MVVTLRSTAKIVTLNGIPARIWEGETESGILVHAYITRIAVREGDIATEFERELEEHAKPSVEVAAIPARLVL